MLTVLFLLVAAVTPNERVGRAVVPEIGLGAALELENDLLRQGLAEFDTPLIERVDVPQGALGPLVSCRRSGA